MQASRTEQPPDDCTRCGACCFTRDPSYLPLFQVDLERLERDDRRFVHDGAEGAFMRILSGHCAALRCLPTGRLVCGIYPRRPDVCRALMRGSGDCREHFFHKRHLAAALCEALRAGGHRV